MVEQVGRCREVATCVVATDDPRIVQAVQSFGGQVVLTRADHESGTNRVAEAVARLEAEGGPGADARIIINVQGDEPEIEPDHVDRLIRRLRLDGQCPMATLACPLEDARLADSPDRVKVVCDLQGRALYFSRARIPYVRGESQPAGSPWLLHIGVYAYRREFLSEMAGWPAGRLESFERLEQLRVLERGLAIAVEVVSGAAPGVDTPADYAGFVERYRMAAISHSTGATGKINP